jgi:N-acetylglucosaminyldiphosphoundecaprenol N-acetyl-beta-D-mannosaminyltransferase
MKQHSINFANIIFKGLSEKSILQIGRPFKIIITVNAEFIVLANENKKFKKIINDNYATFDGQVPYFFAKLRYPDIKFEKISGSDFIYSACEYSSIHSLRVFLLGGNLSSNRDSVNKLKTLYEIEIDGFSPEHKNYPFDIELNKKILTKIKQFKPHFLFVGFGSPKQEYWINDNKKKLIRYGVKWAVGSGGTFEMVSGQLKRAPKTIQKMGLERIYRIFKEPTTFRFKRLLMSLKLFRYL